MSDSERQAHEKIIGRCYKRRMSRRPANVVERIRVVDPASADALLVRMKAAGYHFGPQTVKELKPLPMRQVSLPIHEFFAIMADELAAAQSITPEAFMAAILREGMFEALLEMEAQRKAITRAERQAAAKPQQPETYPDDIDDEMPF